jgi:hypothetical protein
VPRVSSFWFFSVTISDRSIAMSDSPATHSDVLDAFRKLDWRRFEDFLYELVGARGLINLEREALVAGAQVDLVAMEQNVLLGKPIKWAFDAKARKERLCWNRRASLISSWHVRRH